jgi:hypothetical protein
MTSEALVLWAFSIPLPITHCIKDATMIDPATKSGVFLREIAKRLIDGLADQIPDLQERLDQYCKFRHLSTAFTAFQHRGGAAVRDGGAKTPCTWCSRGGIYIKSKGFKSC